MCGLVGYVGKNIASNVVLSSLRRLEYRGYDSAGMALCEGDKIKITKSKGLLVNLEEKVDKACCSSCGIGHTRWATHGEPNEQNAHPQTSKSGNIAIVHNGIIENFSKLKSQFNNIEFKSQTDTEVIAFMLDKFISKSSDENDILRAISSVCRQIKGSYALGILVENFPNKVFFAKKKSPLIIGYGSGENFIASDIPAVLPYTQNVIYLKDGDIGVISKNEVKIFDSKLSPTKLKIKKVDLTLEQVRLGSYGTFMEKEIAQGSFAIVNTILKLKKDKIFTKIEKSRISGLLSEHPNIYIVACGTALHAGMIAKFLIEKECRINVSLDYASEFRYKKPIINKKSLCIFISQSGETADTLASLELAKKYKAYCVAITNVLGSSISQIADFVIPTYAGPEIAVASTKAYVAQITALYYFIALLAKQNDIKLKFTQEEILSVAQKLGNFTTKHLWVDLIPTISEKQSLFFIGRGIDYFLALEGALKLKEISYIHCEAFPAGELKHGSLALVTKGTIVIVILTQKELVDKILNAIYEIKSRGAIVILVSQFQNLKSFVDFFIPLIKTKDVLMPFVAIKPLQELAFLCANHKGLNPDKPRNLAKSVTVE